MSSFLFCPMWPRSQNYLMAHDGSSNSNPESHIPKDRKAPRKEVTLPHPLLVTYINYTCAPGPHLDGKAIKNFGLYSGQPCAQVDVVVVVTEARKHDPWGTPQISDSVCACVHTRACMHKCLCICACACV